MSVQSLTNGILQLGELNISNERYSNASGYLPATATFHSGKTQISLTSPLMNTQSLNIQGVTGGSYYMSYNGKNMELNVGATGGSYGIDFNTATGNVLLTVPTTNTLAVPNLNISDLQISFGSEAANPSIEVLSNNLSIYAGGGGNVNNLSIYAGGISLTSNGQSGILGINSSGQLTWNTVPIS